MSHNHGLKAEVLQHLRMLIGVKQITHRRVGQRRSDTLDQHGGIAAHLPQPWRALRLARARQPAQIATARDRPSYGLAQHVGMRAVIARENSPSRACSSPTCHFRMFSHRDGPSLGRSPSATGSSISTRSPPRWWGACARRPPSLMAKLSCVDETGQPIFLDLLRRRPEHRYVAFDLLWLDGKDLRALPSLICHSNGRFCRVWRRMLLGLAL